MWQKWRSPIQALKKERASARQKQSRLKAKAETLAKVAKGQPEEEPYTRIHGHNVMESSTMRLLGIHYHWTMGNGPAKAKIWDQTQKHIPTARWVSHNMGKKDAIKWFDTVCTPKAIYGKGVCTKNASWANKPGYLALSHSLAWPQSHASDTHKVAPEVAILTNANLLNWEQQIKRDNTRLWWKAHHRSLARFPASADPPRSVPLGAEAT